jgi:UDP-glucuronate 4-epimerase
MKKILITGSAGFIGTHLFMELKKRYHTQGVDLLSDTNFASQKRASFSRNVMVNSMHSSFLDDLSIKPEIVIHLAAETGISSSLSNPVLYLHQNVEGTFNVLEQCRKNGVKYLIYASSSSVYEPNQSIMSENSPHDKQLSFYGTSKRMTEIMVENYCRQFGITAIGLRFFTVYGSWTRPDMAAYKFMKAISEGKEITLYNDGNVYRDFTHVSDVAKAILLITKKISQEPSGSHQIFNIGYGAPVSVKQFASTIADFLNKELKFRSEILPHNELELTSCDNSKLENYINFKPCCELEKGVKEMTDWYKNYRYE